MKRLANYLRALVADANFAVGDRPQPGPDSALSFSRSLDHPTYLRRRLVIAGVTDGVHPEQ
jgi:hypothetical protein